MSGDDSDRARFEEKVTALVGAALPGATFLELDSPLGEEAVSFAAYDEADTRPAEALLGALDEALRADGWQTAQAAPSEGIVGLNAAKEGLGGGTFGVQTSVISFTGFTEPGAAAFAREALAGSGGGAGDAGGPNGSGGGPAGPAGPNPARPPCPPRSAPRSGRPPPAPSTRGTTSRTGTRCGSRAGTRTRSSRTRRCSTRRRRISPRMAGR